MTNCVGICAMGDSVSLCTNIGFTCSSGFTLVEGGAGVPVVSGGCCTSLSPVDLICTVKLGRMVSWTVVTNSAVKVDT